MKASFSFLALFAVFVLVFGTVVAIEQTTARQPIPSAYADDDEDEEEDDDDDEDDRDDVDDDEDEDDDDADENEDDDDDDIKKPQTNRVAPAAKAVQTRTENRGQQQAAQQQSAVASTVQNIRTDDDAATDDDDADEVMDERGAGIGAQVREVAHQQHASKKSVDDAVEAVQQRGAVKTFLIGSDYKNLGQLRSEMVRTRNQIAQMERLHSQAQTDDDRALAQEQLRVLQQEQERITETITAHEEKFSLFGWAVKLFQ